MANKLIELADGVLVEVEVPPDQAQPISGGLADKVTGTLERIRPVLVNVAGALAEDWRELDGRVRVAEAEIELGLSFEGEGNLYITKSKAGANVNVRLVFKPRE